MYFITTKRMLEVCFFQHTPTFIIEPFFLLFSQILQISSKISNFYEKTGKNLLEEPDEFPGFASPL